MYVGTRVDGKHVYGHSDDHPRPSTESRITTRRHVCRTTMTTRSVRAKSPTTRIAILNGAHNFRPELSDSRSSAIVASRDPLLARRPQYSWQRLYNTLELAKKKKKIKYLYKLSILDLLERPFRKILIFPTAFYKQSRFTEFPEFPERKLMFLRFTQNRITAFS